MFSTSAKSSGFSTAYLKYEFTLLFPSQLETKVWITLNISKAWQNFDHKKHTCILLLVILHGAVAKKKPKQQKPSERGLE